MGALELPYCTREMVTRAPDVGTSARNHDQVDRLIEASSREIDHLCARAAGYFLPITATRTFDWPDSGNPPGVLRLDDRSLVSVSALSAGGVAISDDDYFLRPDDGPPYTRVEIDLASSAAFSAGDTHQRAISITGVWAHRLRETTIGALTAAIGSTSATSVSVDAAAAAALGVGSVVKVDSERMLVTGRAAADTTVDTTAALDADRTQSVSVADGSAFAAGELIAIDTETMLIEQVVGNSLRVARGFAGSTLAAHSSGASIFAYRSLTVQRGALGTTAATHLDAAGVVLNHVPAPVEALAVAYTVVGLVGESTGYAGTSGATDNARRVSSDGLVSLERRVIAGYRRKLRHRAV